MTDTRDPMHTIRWGILGCGDVTERKSGPAFQLVPGSQLVAVMRRDREKARDYARRHQVPFWYDAADALIGHPEVDAVYIATPPGDHLEYALRVCAAGKPAYVEKPMARNAAECRRMNVAFADAGLPLFVAYYRRALPRFLKVREILAHNALGEITEIAYRFEAPRNFPPPGKVDWRVDAATAGGGLFLDVGSHVLDLLDWLFGPLGDVHGSAANVAADHDVEDIVSMQFTTPSGVPGTASWNFVGTTTIDELQIVGTTGQLSLAVGNDRPIAVTANGMGGCFPISDPPHVQQPLIATVVAELQGRETCPSTGVSALRTSQVMDTVLDAYYGGRDRAFWEEPNTWPGRRQRND